MAGVNNSSDLVTGLEDLTYGSNERKVNQRGSSELGKDEFLKLLVTQLSNQDPLNPQSDNEFIAQLAQFSALEQMTNLNSTFANTSAYSLVGKQVVVQNTDSAGKVNEVTGIVDYVEIKNGEAYLSIEGKTYEMADLVQVMDTYYAIQKYLPSVEKTEITYDVTNPKMYTVNLNLGSNGYEASSVAVDMNGEFIDASHFTYDDGVLTISPDAFAGLSPGTYDLTFYFDDPYNTVISDQVKVNVVNGGTGDEGDGSTGADPDTGDTVDPDDSADKTDSNPTESNPTEGNPTETE